MLRLLLISIALAWFPFFVNAQILWYEDFSLPNFTTVDNGSTAWTIDLSYACSGSVTGYYYVFNGQFQSYDTDCDARWISEWIDVSAYPSVDVYGVLDGVGGMEMSGTYADSLKIGIRVDGASAITWLDVYAGTTVQNSVSCGGAAVGADSIQIVIQERSTGGDEIHFFDDVTVSVSNDLPTGGGDTLFSRQDGDWDQTTTWSTSVGGSSCGCTPDSNSIVYILCGDVVLLDNDAWAREVHVEFGGRVEWDADNIELNIASNGIVELAVGSYMWEAGRTNAFVEFEGSGTNYLKVYSEDVGFEVDQLRVNHACSLVVEGNGRIDIEDDFELTADGAVVINKFKNQLYVFDDLDVLAANCVFHNDSGELYLNGTLEILDQNFTMVNRDTVFVNLDLHGDNADNGHLTNYGQIWVNGNDIEMSFNSDNFVIDNYGLFRVEDDIIESGTGGAACEFHNRAGGYLFLGHDNVDLNWELWANYDSNTVDYGRNGNQTYVFVPQDAYWNLTLSGSGTKTTTGDLDINGSVLISGTARLTVDPGDDDLTVAGNWRITSTNATPFAYGTETVTFDGAGKQWVNANAGALFRNVVINKSDSLKLLSSMRILPNGVLTLTTGHIASRYSDILIFSDNASVTGASNASFVEGPMRKVGNDAFVYPCGNFGNYQSLGISAPALTTDIFTVKYLAEDPRNYYNDTLLEAGINHVSTEEMWLVDRNVGTSSVYLTLAFDAASGGVSDIDSLIIAHWDGTEWTNEGNGLVTGNESGGTVRTASPVGSFSPFTLGSVINSFTANPLPIELSNFEALRMGDEVAIQWITLSEVNSDYFEVERSTDEEDWTTVLVQEAAGNSAEELLYEDVDRMPPNADLFYRLKQVDLDASVNYSEVVYVPLIETVTIGDQWLCYPNPAVRNGNLHFQYRGSALHSVQIQIFDMFGREAFSAQKQLNKQKNSIVLPLSTMGLKAGHYLVKLQSEAGEAHFKLVLNP